MAFLDLGNVPDRGVELLERLLARVAEFLTSSVRERVVASSATPAGALIEGSPEEICSDQADIASRPGLVILCQAADPAALSDARAYCLDWLCEEVSTSINTTAAGGNASLMAMV